ncbi:MAG: glycosyltransferase family 2 protein [Microthrixaceae bacterium]
MFDGKRVVVVVPAYKEEALIGEVIKTMPEIVDRIVVVNDASPDGTSRVVRELDDPRVHLIDHETNTGVGGAVVTGYRAALDDGGELMAVMAGDAQSDPDYLEDLLRPIAEGTCDMAKANRFFSGDSFAGMPRYRVFGNVMLSMANKFASGYWHLFDPQNGYVAVSREALLAIPLHRISAGYTLENSMLLEMNIVGGRVLDVPVPAIYGDETSTIKLSRFVPSVLKMLIGGFWSRIIRKYVVWSFSPIALFLLSGLALVLVGLIAGAVAIYQTIGPPVATPGTVLMAVAPMLVGIQLLVSGLAMDVSESRSLTPEIDRFGGHATRRDAQRRQDGTP